ncbi:MAG: long-chain-fatty-acid--CoA ligase [Hyphomonadaceae bacterium]
MNKVAHAARLRVHGSVSDLIRTHAEIRPSHDAVVFGDRRISYGELHDLGRRIGAGLLSAGVSPGARVGLLAKNCDSYFELLAGCSAARSVLTPVNWRLSADEISFVLKDADIQALFVSSAYFNIAQRLMSELGRSDRLFLLDGPEQSDCIYYPSWRDAAKDESALEPTASDVVLQIYSSGTTGSPKGVQLTHANFLAAAEQAHHGLVGRWSDQDRLLIALPLFHAGALLTASYALQVGATSIILKDADIEALMRAASQHEATKIGFVPALMQLVIDHPGFSADRFPALDTIIYGGSAITPELLQQAVRAFRADFVQLFGMSETFTAGTVLTGPDHHDPARLATCGRPMHGIQVRVVRGDGGEADTNEPGEILIKSATIMKGYWRRPEQTAEVMQDGWYHTGDVGSIDAEGYLTIRDRLRDMVISGGENIYPVEIENVLIQHPDVADCAVIGVPDPRWGETVKAVVVAAAGAPKDAEALIVFLQERLARYKCPRSIAFTETLPRNATGKVLKRVLREAYAQPTAP